MLDVHPPHHPVHAWKDFFIHIATIVVGLLIAVGLEQTVEHLHHRSQLAELRTALEQDNQKALRDEQAVEHYYLGQIAWITANIKDATQALKAITVPHYTPIPPSLEQEGNAILTHPIDPAWKAARASNLIEVMPQEDVKAFAEIDWMIDRGYEAERRFRESTRHAHDASAQFLTGPGVAPDLSNATHADIAEYISLLSAMRSNAEDQIEQYQYLRGALLAVLRGERDLDKINAYENEVRDGRVPRS
jgi:hypothetical protein